MNNILISLITLLFFYSNGYSKYTLLHSSDSINNHFKNPEIYYFEDSTKVLEIKDVINLKDFKKSIHKTQNFGVTKSSIWLKFKLLTLNLNEELAINVNQPLLSKIEFYAFDKSKNLIDTKKIINSSFNSRTQKYIPYLFDINTKGNDTINCYLKLESNNQFVVPIIIDKKISITNQLIINEVSYSFYGGFLLALFIYNLFIYFTVKDNSYLFYVIYILFVCLTQLTVCGFSFKYLWPDSKWLTSQSLNLLSCLGGISAILFIQHFLNVSKNIPKANYAFHFLNIIFTLNIFISILGFVSVAFQIVQITTLLGSIYSLYIGFIISRKKYRPAKFFMIAWSVLLIGAIIFVLKDFEIVTYNSLTINSLQYASGIEVILLSFALGDRINILEKEKQESRAQAILVLEENEKIIREQNVMLETKVKERTQELELANDEISRTLKNLKDAQAQLVHAEKMASLGQLTAGIAHEINNPINFVTSSINPLKRDLDFIAQIISSAESFLNEEDKQKRLQDMKTLLDDMDYNYLLEEINMLLNGILEGSTRTSEIVKSLRNFSRLDETDFKKANIIEGLESTLLLLNSSLSDAKIQVKNRFLATPIITCQPGKLNQVYMNIINNAIYATKARKDLSTPGTIDINVTEENESILIKIKDNGIGMSQKTKEKLFEPFFTTKDVGEGTGLGLSIVYNIIEGHKGKIEVDSEEGVGTVFSITLPTNL